MQTGKKLRSRTTSQYFVILIVFLIFVNAFLGFLLSFQSASAMRAQIQGRMLDISNTAAAMLDGDTLRNISPENKGSPEYENVMKTLSYFQNNIELKFIYCIRDLGNKNFVFGLDPSDDPGEPRLPAAFGFCRSAPGNSAPTPAATM